MLANDGKFKFLDTAGNENIVAYQKYNDARSVVILINPTDVQQSFTLPFDLKGRITYGFKDKGNTRREVNLKWMAINIKFSHLIIEAKRNGAKKIILPRFFIQ